MLPVFAIGFVSRTLSMIIKTAHKSTLHFQLAKEPKETWIFRVSGLICGEGNGTPLQYSCLENPMDRGALWAAVHGVAQSLTRLSDFTFTFHFPALEKEMATHSRVLAWRIPGMEDPGGLLSMGLHRVGHDWSDLTAAAASLDNKHQRMLAVGGLSS